MSLRRFDDWDEATEEARQNAIRRGEVNPVEPIITKDYDYGISVVITKEELALTNINSKF